MYPHKLFKKYDSASDVEASVRRIANFAEWNELKAKMRDGDEIWSFSTSDKSWEMMCGRSGYALVRNGTVVFFCVTEMN
ncbi:MAG: hypothetical protein GJ680_21125 [Alteromonadaceae bacterium]|nr:hypothetical protein [Alteromonadaceae bacterium]